MTARPPLSEEDEAIVRGLERRKPSEVVPILLELARRQSARRRAADLVTQYAGDAFVVPSAVDQRATLRFDQAALEAAAEFEAVLLSPLAPLGTCAVVSPTSQDRSVTTARTTEVVSDATNVLALECAKRLLRGETYVRLATLHQVVRPQRYPAVKGWSQHFRLFAMAEAGLSRSEHGLEVDAVTAHASVFLRLFEICEGMGCRFLNRRAVLHVAKRAEVLGERIHRRLSERLPSLSLELRPGFDSNYYDGIRLLIGAESAKADGRYYELGDVGVFDWMGKLTSNRRTRLVAAGFGIQLLPLLFMS